MASVVRIDGLREVVKALRALPAEISGNRGGPMRGALFAAAKIIRDEARNNAPVGKGTPSPGNLKRSIYIYRDRNPKASGANERYTLTVRTGRRKRRAKLGPGVRSVAGVIAGGNAWYWFLTEFGSSMQPGQRWMTRAFESKKNEAVQVFVRELEKGVEKATMRARQKAGAR